MANEMSGNGSVETGGFGWRKLLSFAAITAALGILLATFLVFGGDFDPPFIVMLVLFAVGGVLALRPGKAGVVGIVLATIAGLMFTVFAGPFAFFLLETPESKEIIPVVSILLLSLTVVISAIVLAIKGRGRAFEPSGAAKALGGVVLVLIVAVAAWNIYLVSTFESEAAQPGDIRVVTEDFEFAPNSLTASPGTVSVHVTNRDDTLHTFTVEELGVDVSVPSGKSVRATFQADGGQYRVVCKPHEPDMAGTLQVA